MRNFQILQDKLIKTYKELQDIQNEMYGVKPFVGTSRIECNFVCFYDLKLGGMNTTITDSNMVEYKLLSDIPGDCLIAYASFKLAVIDWVLGKGDFPCSAPEDKDMTKLRGICFDNPIEDTDNQNTDTADKNYTLR